jgi:hypothetical protein
LDVERIDVVVSKFAGIARNPMIDSGFHSFLFFNITTDSSSSSSSRDRFNVLYSTVLYTKELAMSHE